MELDKLEKKLETDPEYQLPAPQGLMSAKTYKLRFADSVVERLKMLLKEVLTKFYIVWDDYLRLSTANRKLHRQNEQLTEENKCLSVKNKELMAESKNYRLICRVIGKGTLNKMLEQSKINRHSRQQTLKTHESR